MATKSGPVGDISLWPAATPPDGWLRCDGSTYDPLLYPDLFGLIGDSFGAAAPTIGAWTQRLGTGSTPAWYDVSFGGPAASQKWVAVGDGQVAYSSDGLTWTITTTNVSTVQLSSVYWSSRLQRWIAVGNQTANPGQGAAFTSPDGITWTAATLPPATADSGGSSSAIVEVGTTLIAATGVGSVYRSTDGSIWVAAPIATGSFRGLATNGSRIVASGLNGAAPIISTSDDAGATWTARVVAGTGLGKVAYAPPLGEYLALATDGTTRRSTDNGITWAAGSAGVAANGARWLKWIGGFFLNATDTAGRLDYRRTGSTAVVNVATGFGGNHIGIGGNGTLVVATGGSRQIRTAPLTAATSLPDLRDRFALGASATRALASSGGSFTTSGPSAVSPTNLIIVGQVADQNHTHQAVPPYVALHFIIKAAPDATAGPASAFDAVAYATGNGLISYRPSG